MGHNEQMVSTNKLILRDNAGLALSGPDIGTIILSGPIAYLNTGTTWAAMNA